MGRMWPNVGRTLTLFSMMQRRTCECCNGPYTTNATHSIEASSIESTQLRPIKTFFYRRSWTRISTDWRTNGLRRHYMEDVQRVSTTSFNTPSIIQRIPRRLPTPDVKPMQSSSQSCACFKVDQV